MSTIRHSGKLVIGILVDQVVHRSFTLRPATLQDTYRATESVPIPDALKDDMAARVAYEMAVDDAQVFCQIETLGTLDPVPLPQALASAIEPSDMEILREAARSVKKKLLQSRSSSAPSGKRKRSSSAPVTD